MASKIWVRAIASAAAIGLLIPMAVIGQSKGGTATPPPTTGTGGTAGTTGSTGATTGRTHDAFHDHHHPDNFADGHDHAAHLCQRPRGVRGWNRSHRTGGHRNRV